MATFQAMKRNSRSNANIPSTLASTNELSSCVELFSKLRPRIQTERTDNSLCEQERSGYSVFIGGYFPTVSIINPVASRTSIFDPSRTGMAHVAPSATS